MTTARRKSAPRLSPRAAAHIAQLVLQGLMLAFFASPWSLIHGFPLDDAWIHQVVARTLGEHGTLGYAVGQHGAGATSYLWAALLAVNFRALHFDPVAYTLSINVALSLVCGQFLLAVVLSEERPDRSPMAHAILCTAVSALGCFGGSFLWFAYSGMECNLLIAFVLAGIYLYVVPSPKRADERVSWSAVGAGLMAAGAAITRPETVSFGPLLLVATPFVGRRRKDAAWVLGLWLAGVAAYVGSNLIATGTVAPATLAGRRWLWLEWAAGLSKPVIAWRFVCDWMLRLRDYTLGTSATPAFWIALGLSAYGVVGWLRSRSLRMLLLLAWTAIHVATYVALMPVAGHGGRYQPLVPLLFLTAVAAGSVDLVLAGARALRAVLATERPEAHVPALGAGPALVTMVAALAPWAALVGVGVRDWSVYNAKAVAHVQGTECALGEFINELPADATVASFDIGCSGFVAHRTILDLGGLSDAHTADLMRLGRIWEFMRDHHVDYVALPLDYSGTNDPGPLNFAARLELVDNPALTLEPLRYFESPFGVWKPGADATQNAAPRQGLFRVEYTGEPGPTNATVARATPPDLDDPHGSVRAEMRPQLNDDLRVMAGAGVKVHFAMGKAEQPPAEGDAWVVNIADSGVWVSPRTGLTGLSPEVARAALARAVHPYVRMRDFGGAAEASLHTIASLERRGGNRRFFPRLPSLPEPSLGPDRATPEETTLWGGPLAAAILLLGLVLEQLAKFGRPGARRVWERASRWTRKSVTEPGLPVVTAGSVGVRGGDGS